MTGDRTPGADVHYDACHSPECPCYQAGLEAAWGNAEPPLIALRAEVKRLQAELERHRSYVNVIVAEPPKCPTCGSTRDCGCGE